jgi:rSAM/selenodomain-associated transferase 2
VSVDRTTPTISAIVPTWREAAVIARTVTTCAALADETIVADAGSPDATAAIAAAAGARVVRAPRGRGPQLNAGARAATGEVLLFIHADTELPPQARPAIAAALADPAVIGGNFKLRFAPATLAARIYSLGNHLRRRALGIYYGDSCIFVRRAIFERLGGFADLPIFEDHEFVRRLEAAGRTHYETAVLATTSSRRFLARPVRTLGIWALLQGLYTLGVPAHRLARLYEDIR